MKRNKTIRILLSLIVLLTTGGVSRVCAETIDNVSYLDANGDPQTADNVTVLTGSETTLAAGWYIARGELNYTSTLTLNGEVHLILEDNAAMTVGTKDNPIVGHAIEANGDFTIYGQGGTTEGKLIATGLNPNDYSYGIWVDNGGLTINGGTIKATGGDDGIHFRTVHNTPPKDLIINGGDIEAKGSKYSGIYTYYGDVTINGGKLKAIGPERGISPAGQTGSGKFTINDGQVEATGSLYGIYAKGTITISGGQVKATATGTENNPYGIYSYNNDIILGWTNSDDYIYANSYHIGNNNKKIKTTSDKRFIAYNAAEGLAASGIIDGGNNNISASSINGKYLRPRVAGNLLQVDAAKGITASGYKRAYDINTTHYYIYESGEEVTLNLPNYGQNGAEFTSTPANTIANAETTDGSVLASTSFQMPASDVTITDAKYYSYDVDYQTWDGNQKKLVSAKTDPNTKVYILDGSETTLGTDNTETWHVAQGALNYSGRLLLKGNVHLILANNAEMTVNNEENVNSNAILHYGYSSDNSFTIYGQSVGTGEKIGSLSAVSTGDAIRIQSGDITINGGSVTTINTGNGSGLYASPASYNPTKGGLITINGGTFSSNPIPEMQSSSIFADYGGSIVINGGTVNATGALQSLYIKRKQDSTNGDHIGSITINGGKVTATCLNNLNYGIYANSGDIILNWSNEEDFIFTNRYTVLNGYKVKIAAGKRFVAYDAETGVAANASSLLLGSATNTQATEIPNTISLTDAVAENTIAGKTLRPLDGYYVKDEAGLTFNGKTNADGSAKPDFTITTGTGNNAVTTPYYIYKASTDQNPVSVVVNSTGHADDHMEINATTATAAITQSDAEASSHCFAMPAEDVTITGIKYYTYGVDYIDPTAAANEQAKTTSENTKVYILEGTHGATALAGGWYVVNNTNGDSEDADLAYTGKLTLNGDVNFILGDKAKTTINSVDDHGIETSHKIAFFAQSKGNDAGSLSIESTSTTYKMYRAINAAPDYQTGYDITINGGNITLRSKGYAIYCGTLTINGGIVDASSSNDWGFNLVSDFIMNGGQATVIAADENSPQGRGLYANNTITINGGQLTAKGSTDGLNAMYNLTINGGKVTALYTGNQQYKNAICSRQGNITLGWTNPDDYIYTNSYHLDKSPNQNQVIMIAAGKRFVAYDAETGVAANASSLLLGSISSTDATEIPNTISLDDATADLTIAGKYLRPLDGYTVANSAGVLLDGKTETVNNIVVAKPDFTIENSGNVIPYYIYKENATVTVASTGHDTDHMEINADFDLNQTEEQALAHSFQMLDKDIILQNVKYYNVKVPYLTWDDTEKKQVSATTGDYYKVYLLQGTETTLSDDGETWYVAKGNVDYTNKLTLNHDTHIILADNAKMTVTVTDANAIGAKSADITIYGQSTDAATMGRLTTDSNTGGIVASSNQDINVNVTINGGYIDVSKGGIYSSAKTANVIINGGIVEAESIATFANGDTKVIINSGNVTVSDEIEPISTTSTAETILSWTNPTDYVNAKSYSGTVKIAQGKYFSTSDASYGSKDADYEFGAGENPAATVLNNVKLMPTVAVQTGNAAFLDMCSTDGCYKVMGNAKAFPVVGYDITHKTVKLGAALAGVPNGVPVVICTVDGEGNPTDAALGADVMLVCATGQDAIDIQNSVATEGGNMPSALFFAGDANKTWEQLLEAAMQSQYPTADATQLASLMSERMFLELANGRFRPVAVNLANTSKLGKALLTITKYDFLKMIKAPATAAPGFHGIAIELGEETEVTGVREVKEVREVKDNTWYSLDGRKLDGAPNKKGIYVVNGHKVVIR